ncbi:MAG: winged helix-turn-helix domain-containing protein [Anaerolineae bacterium]|nr:winged helix-turn-helix domain-containing protein [Anaerolineae bacterium]
MPNGTDDMPEILIHTEELNCLHGHTAAGACCIVTGMSNTGKSSLLRYLVAQNAPVSEGCTQVLIYIDCNRVLDLSEQGFYEVVLRATRSRLHQLSFPDDLIDPLDQAYRKVTHPPNPFAIPLGFIEGIETLLERAQCQFTLIFDEFDEPFAEIEGRMFLNLRALRDRYRNALTYIVGTERPLDQIRDDTETAEFRELFAGHICTMNLTPNPEVERWVQELAGQKGGQLSDEEVAFVVEQAGAHPGLLQTISLLTLRARSVAPETYAKMGRALIVEAMPGDELTRRECERLWRQLAVTERAALHALAVGTPIGDKMAARLARLGLTDVRGAIFGACFAEFARQRGQQRTDLPGGIWLDVDAGEVYINGQKAPMLTNLEYRLLQVLYERKNKLCDKYQLIEQVWGEQYIDEVDDARIEKLISRLRAKIEEDPTDPHYLVTVRGRGYRFIAQPKK